MSILDRFKSLAGVGTSLVVEMPQKYYQAGNPVTFVVTIKSDRDIRIRKVTAAVISSQSAPTNEDWVGESLQTATISEEVLIEGGGQSVLSGSLTIPENAGPSNEAPEATQYWALQIDADVISAPDLHARCGFIVAPACEAAWETVEPIIVRVKADRYAIKAQGTYTVVKPPALTYEELYSLVASTIPAALQELLEDRPNLVIDGQHDAESYRELSGILREIATPRIRESAEIPLEAVHDVNVTAVEVTPL